MSVFTDSELAYFRNGSRNGSSGPHLGRIATVGADGTPHVVPVGWSYNADEDAIEVRGRNLAATKKFRDAERSGRAAIVIDDMASTDPWRPRAIEVRGRAEIVHEPKPMIRIRPERIVSFGLGDDRSARSVA